MNRRFRRLAGMLLVTIVAAGATAQAGCGVVHCVIAQGEATDVPPCHSSSDAPSSPSHDRGEGTGACCVTLTANANADVPSMMLDPPLAVSAGLPMSEARTDVGIAAVVLASRPPGTIRSVARLPLRV